MSKPRLIYFDIAGSRGEECRIALHLAGVDFEDMRIAREEWPALKPKMTFGSLPILELPGKPPLAQSNAILVYIGRQYGLHPKDDFEAARHEALMNYVEDLRHIVGPTLRITDETQKRAAREELACDYLPTWGTNVDNQLTGSSFFGGDKLHVVDIKLYIIVRWFMSGTIDYVPQTVFDHCAKLKGVYRSVSEHPGVTAWLARAAR